MTENPVPSPVPPYVSFGTLLNQLDRMEHEGIPARIDQSYLVGMAGGTRSQFMVCLRSLGLINEDSYVTDTLTRLAKSPEQRPEILAEILRSRFPDLVALNANATRGQLEELMVGHGLANPDTRRKAMSFYVSAATFAGFSLSPHLRPAKAARGGSQQARSRPPRKRTNATSRTASPPPPINEVADMRRAYFDLLIGKAKEANSDDGQLLDRIERLVGVMEADADKE